MRQSLRRIVRGFGLLWSRLFERAAAQKSLLLFFCKDQEVNPSNEKTIPMKKIFVKTLPGFFIVSMTCCGGTLADVHYQSDYTKYKVEKQNKVEISLKKK